MILYEFIGKNNLPYILIDIVMQDSISSHRYYVINSKNSIRKIKNIDLFIEYLDSNNIELRKISLSDFENVSLIKHLLSNYDDLNELKDENSIDYPGTNGITNFDKKVISEELYELKRYGGN